MSCPVHLAFRRRLPNWVQYDWLGNQTATDDDSHGFYDRSLGTVTNNTASQKPYQLAGAEQTTGTRTGALATKYDDAGNLVAMAVRRDGSCFPEGATCSQQYRYEWDEVGRLVEAKRWDVQGPSLDSAPVGQAAAHLRYGYDASDNRVIKTATDDQGEQVHTVYIFGSLELRRAQFDAVESPNDYTDDIDTEVGYLFAHGVRLARLHWDDNGSPAVGGANLHVLFELGDHLGSSSKVLDKSTSELVEASTYMGYGQAESDYRPGRWKNFREDYRFTGKEEDSEVGLTYFGKRFLSSQLGRWASADPLGVHTSSTDLNLYAYVRGSLLRFTDLTGLDASDPFSAMVSDIYSVNSKTTYTQSYTDTDGVQKVATRMVSLSAPHGYHSEEEAMQAAAEQYAPFSMSSKREFSWRVFTRLGKDGELSYHYGDAMIGPSGGGSAPGLERLLQADVQAEPASAFRDITSAYAHTHPGGSDFYYFSTVENKARLRTEHRLASTQELSTFYSNASASDKSRIWGKSDEQYFIKTVVSLRDSGVDMDDLVTAMPRSYMINSKGELNRMSAALDANGGTLPHAFSSGAPLAQGANAERSHIAQNAFAVAMEEPIKESRSLPLSVNSNVRTILQAMVKK